MILIHYINEELRNYLVPFSVSDVAFFFQATSLQLGQAWPRWREVCAQKYDQYRRL